MNDITNFRLSKAANDVADKLVETKNSITLLRLLNLLSPTLSRIIMENLILQHTLYPIALAVITV